MNLSECYSACCSNAGWPVATGFLLGALYLAEVALWLRALGMIHSAPPLFLAVVMALAGTSAAAGGRVGRWTARLSST